MFTMYSFTADFPDHEGDHFQAHLVQVGCTIRPHSTAYHLRFLHDLFHRQLTDNPTQVSFHHQTVKAFPLLLPSAQRPVVCRPL